MIRRLVLLCTIPTAALAAEPELRIPDEAWATRFEGLHAVEGACDEPESVWALASGTVEMGRTVCTGLGKMTWEEGWLFVPLSQCRRMGEPVGERALWLQDAGEGRILARIGDAEVRLVACQTSE